MRCLWIMFVTAVCFLFLLDPSKVEMAEEQEYLCCLGVQGELSSKLFGCQIMSIIAYGDLRKE